MKILLVDVDSVIPNLALMKISAQHKNRGDDVYLNHCTHPDKVYFSCVFKKNKPNREWLEKLYPDSKIKIGGSGYDLNVKLNDEIEFLKPDYDLYPSTYSQGYTTRGCIRECPWCIVHKKEGIFKKHQHIQKFHDERFDTVMVMDNNWLADKEWFMDNTDYILDNNLKVIEHGMDIRLLDGEIASRLNELKFPTYMKFAFDQKEDESNVLNGIGLLEDAGINIRQKVMFYVLSGFNTSFEEDVYRCNLLKKCNTNAFVMPYRKDYKIKNLARWANRKWFYWGMSFDEYRKQR